jgi:hypothetical protein
MAALSIAIFYDPLKCRRANIQAHGDANTVRARSASGHVIVALKTLANLPDRESFAQFRPRISFMNFTPLTEAD